MYEKYNLAWPQQFKLIYDQSKHFYILEGIILKNDNYAILSTYIHECTEIWTD